MAKSKNNKYRNPLTNFRVPQKDRKMPLTSLEDIANPEEDDYFTIDSTDDGI